MISFTNIQQIKYAFDVNSDIDEKDFISIDSWKPKNTERSFREPSQWRKKQNKKYNLYTFLDNDTINKVITHIKYNVNDDFILNSFKIDKKKLDKIKELMLLKKTNAEILYIIRKDSQSRIVYVASKRREKKICTAIDCINLVDSRLLCSKHLARLKKHGVIYDDELRKIGVQIKPHRDKLE